METIKLMETINVMCEAKKTRTGFKHEAILFVNSRKINFAKCIYYNRTWERFTYESVILKVIRTSDLSDRIKINLNDIVSELKRW